MYHSHRKRSSIQYIVERQQVLLTPITLSCRLFLQSASASLSATLTLSTREEHTTVNYTYGVIVSVHPLLQRICGVCLPEGDECRYKTNSVFLPWFKVRFLKHALHRLSHQWRRYLHDGGGSLLVPWHHGTAAPTANRVSALGEWWPYCYLGWGITLGMAICRIVNLDHA